MNGRFQINVSSRCNIHRKSYLTGTLALEKLTALRKRAERWRVLLNREKINQNNNCWKKLIRMNNNC